MAACEAQPEAGVYVLDQLVSPGSFQFSRGSGVSFRSSCRNRRRKRRKGKEKRREIRSATVKRTIRVVVGGIGGRDRRAEGERASERERERERERARVRERSAAKGNGGTIPVRLSVVRTSVVLLQSRICAFTRTPRYISARRAHGSNTKNTDPGCEPRNRGWASSGTQKRGAERCGRVFRPWRAVSLYPQRK